MEIELNTKLTVLPEDQTGQDNLRFLTSSFEEILPDGACLIAAPVFGGIMVPLQIGETIKVSFLDKKASYGFDAQVLERLRIDGLNYLKIRPTTKIERVQRRQDFRLVMLLDGMLDQGYVDADGKRMVRRNEVVTKDVSAGGVALYLNARLDVNERVVVHLPLGSRGAMKPFQAQVRRVCRVERDGTRWQWCASLMFVHRDKSEKDELVQYLFYLQRKMLKPDD